MSGQVFGLIFLCLIGFAVSLEKPSGCADLVTLRDNDKDTVKPKIIYFEGPRQEAEIYCEGQNLGVVELVSNQGSLGVVEKDAHKMICRLGRWYTLNKYREIVPVKEVACLIHISNWLW